MRRKPPLPESLHAAWWSFVDCAELVEGGRRRLFATLPAGRVDVGSVGVGLDALEAALADVNDWLPGWRDLTHAWDACAAAVTQARVAIPVAREVAATTSELDALLDAVAAVVEPLAAFADAERGLRDRFRLPTTR